MSACSENSEAKHDNENYLQFDPSVLPVGSTDRQPLGNYLSPQMVRFVEDLPSRLYLGDLEPKSFNKIDSGWTVRYQDSDPDTFVELELSNGSLEARFVWQGIEGMIVCASGRDWRGLLQQLSIVFPESWEEASKKRIESSFNARVLVHSDEMPMMIGFPDGAFRTVIIPISSDRLPELVDLLDTIDEDTKVAAVVNISVFLTEARVDYVQGHCPDVPNDPKALARHSREAIRLPCNGLPRYQTLDDGRRLLAVDRWVYLAHIGCSFRDLERVMGHCKRLGFIGSNETPSGYPNGAEWSALVLPKGMEMLNPKIQYFDKGPSRRIAYGKLTSLDRQLEVVDSRNIKREEALDGLVAAREWASLLPEVYFSSNQEEQSD